MSAEGIAGGARTAPSLFTASHPWGTEGILCFTAGLSFVCWFVPPVLFRAGILNKKYLIQISASQKKTPLLNYPNWGIRTVYILHTPFIFLCHFLLWNHPQIISFCLLKLHFFSRQRGGKYTQSGWIFVITCSAILCQMFKLFPQVILNFASARSSTGIVESPCQ